MCWPWLPASKRMNATTSARVVMTACATPNMRLFFAEITTASTKTIARLVQQASPLVHVKSFHARPTMTQIALGRDHRCAVVTKNANTLTNAGPVLLDSKPASALKFVHRGKMVPVATSTSPCNAAPTTARMITNARLKWLALWLLSAARYPLTSDCPYDDYIAVTCGGGNACHYQNQCLASASGFSGSECEEVCPSIDNGTCDNDFVPVVCGEHYCQYDNQCKADAAGFSAAKCEVIMCPYNNEADCSYTDQKPVHCGADDCHYTNQCFASASGFRPGDCIEICPTVMTTCVARNTSLLVVGITSASTITSARLMQEAFQLISVKSFRALTSMKLTATRRVQLFVVAWMDAITSTNVGPVLLGSAPIIAQKSAWPARMILVTMIIHQCTVVRTSVSLTTSARLMLLDTSWEIASKLNIPMATKKTADPRIARPQRRRLKRKRRQACQEGGKEGQKERTDNGQNGRKEEGQKGG